MKPDVILLIVVVCGIAGILGLLGVLVMKTTAKASTRAFVPTPAERKEIIRNTLQTMFRGNVFTVASGCRLIQYLEKLTIEGDPCRISFCITPHRRNLSENYNIFVSEAANLGIESLVPERQRSLASFDMELTDEYDVVVSVGNCFRNLKIVIDKSGCWIHDFHRVTNEPLLELLYSNLSAIEALLELSEAPIAKQPLMRFGSGTRTLGAYVFYYSETCPITAPYVVDPYLPLELKEDAGLFRQLSETLNTPTLEIPVADCEFRVRCLGVMPDYYVEDLARINTIPVAPGTGKTGFMKRHQEMRNALLNSARNDTHSTANLAFSDIHVAMLYDDANYNRLKEAVRDDCHQSHRVTKTACDSKSNHHTDYGSDSTPSTTD